MREFQQRYENMKKALRILHWNETDGIWYDYDLERQVFSPFLSLIKFHFKVHSNSYYVSNALPLYAKCFDDDSVVPHRVYDYLKVSKVALT